MFGLSLYTGEKELRDFFSKYGPMEDLKVIYDHQTGKSRGFAFIYYEDIEDAIDVSTISSHLLTVWVQSMEGALYLETEHLSFTHNPDLS